MSVINVTVETFEEQVLKSDIPVFVDFYADWCGPCKMMMPLVEEIAAEKSDGKFCKIDIDKNMELAKKYRVMTIPNFIVFNNGQIHKRAQGVLSKEQVVELFE